MKWTLAGLVIGLLIGLPSAARAVWFRSESVEWQTNVCDDVAIAEVMNTSESELAKEIELAKDVTKDTPPREIRRTLMVACKITKLLKGRLSGSLSFRQICYLPERDPPIDDQPLRPRDEILIFAVEKPARADQKVIFWVNLTKPDVVQAQHAAYDNDCKWLAKGDAVLKAVQARIDVERKMGKTRHRGVIVDMSLLPNEECYWDFVRTADPEYKAKLIKQLHDSRWPGGQEAAIYNLISYPGQDTINLIRPFLKDASTQEVGSSGATVKVFHLRQAAYAALSLIGANPAKPEGFQPGRPVGLLWSAGFEDRGYFPYGDWQRIDD